MSSRIIAWRVTVYKASSYGWGVPEPASWAPVFADPYPADDPAEPSPQVRGRRRRHRLCSPAVPLMPYG